MSVMNSTMHKGKKKKQNALVIADNSSKIVALKEAIEELRREVAEIEKEIGELQGKQKEERSQWIWFLRKMLKGGYFLRRGVIPILEEMVDAHYSPKLEDMPDSLDDTSKRCLIA